MTLLVLTYSHYYYYYYYMHSGSENVYSKMGAWAAKARGLFLVAASEGTIKKLNVEPTDNEHLSRTNENLGYLKTSCVILNIYNSGFIHDRFRSLM